MRQNLFFCDQIVRSHLFHHSWPRNISDKERKLGYSPGKRLADAISEALNSGKIVKATKRRYTFCVLWILGQLWVICHHLPGSRVSHSCKWWVACAGREGRTLKEGQGKLMVEWQEMQHSRALALLFRRYFAPRIIRFLKIPNSFSFGFLIVKINLFFF